MSISTNSTVGDIGERELLRLLTPYLAPARDDAGNVGVGDDCAERRLPAGRMVVTSDLLVAGNHFLDEPSTDWFGVGHKSIAANLSDLAAAGAIPDSLYVSLAAPSTTPVENILQLYRGMHTLAERFGAAIAGGDTASSPTFTIGVTAIGHVASDQAPVLRSNLQPGDALYVTGELGGARAGLHCLLYPEKVRGVSLDTRDGLIRRHMRPEPRVAAGQALAASGNRVALIDISDGLANEARLLADASALHVVIDLDLLPVRSDVVTFCRALELGDAAEFAVFSGEEYELLAGMPPEQMAGLLETGWNDIGLTLVGRVTEGAPGVTFQRNGADVSLHDATYTHFSPASGV